MWKRGSNHDTLWDEDGVNDMDDTVESNFIGANDSSIINHDTSHVEGNGETCTGRQSRNNLTVIEIARQKIANHNMLGQNSRKNVVVFQKKFQDSIWKLSKGFLGWCKDCEGTFSL
jgi:hypothetical protein